MTLPPSIQRFADLLRDAQHDRSYLKRVPTEKQAAVLVLIYEDGDQLRVLLTTRAKTLKSHGGRTAFPGGKADSTDTDIVATAYREAYEEVGLPFPHELDCLHTIGVFQPYPFHQLVVTPVVAFLSQPDRVLPLLKAEEREVDHIFTHALEAFIDPSISQRSESLVQHGGEHWPFEEEYHYYKDYIIQQYGNTSYRYHQFRSSATPVTGLTADILIDIASLLYDKPPVYERLAPNQLMTYEQYVAATSTHSHSDNSTRSQ